MTYEDLLNMIESLSPEQRKHQVVVSSSNDEDDFVPAAIRLSRGEGELPLGIPYIRA